MKINPLIIEQYWTHIVVEQLAYEYQEKGYQTKKWVEVQEGLVVDLRVEKDTKAIYFQVKGRSWTKEDIQKANDIRKLVTSESNAKYEIVWSSPPQEKTIEVEGIELLLVSIISENMGELGDLSSQTLIDSVEDVEIFSAVIGESSTQVTGSGTVNVELTYGGSRDEVSMYDSYPFDFEILLGDNNLSIIQDNITVDTSSFYE